MIYISLFINPSDAIGYELNNIPWIGLNLKKDTPLYCNKPNKRLVVDDNGNVDVVDDVQHMPYNEIWYAAPAGKKLYTYNNQEYNWKELIKEFGNITVLGPKIISENFDNITGMYKMIFDDNVTDIGIISANPLTTYVTFASLLNIRCNANLIILPNSVINIRKHAFYLNQNLTTITIPNSVIDVSNYAFAGCKNITNITIGRSVTNLADNVLMDDPDISERQYTGSLQTITVVNGLTYNYNGSEYFPITLTNGTNVILHMWNREDESDDVNVTIDNESVTLDGNLTYSDNGYETLYSQNTYDPSLEESASNYEINTSNIYPEEGDEYWTYCNEEPQSSVNITINDESTTADPNLSYYDLGYTELYTLDYYPYGGSPLDYEVDTSNIYPENGDFYYTYCNEESSDVLVVIDGNPEYLDPNESYINQGYSELYTLNTYPSGDEPSYYYVDTTSYPSEGDEYWTYCNPEEPDEPEVPSNT